MNPRVTTMRNACVLRAGIVAAVVAGLVACGGGGKSGGTSSTKDGKGRATAGQLAYGEFPAKPVYVACGQWIGDWTLDLVALRSCDDARVTCSKPWFETTGEALRRTRLTPRSATYEACPTTSVFRFRVQTARGVKLAPGAYGHGAKRPAIAIEPDARVFRGKDRGRSPIAAGEAGKTITIRSVDAEQITLGIDYASRRLKMKSDRLRFTIMNPSPAPATLAATGSKPAPEPMPMRWPPLVEPAGAATVPAKLAGKYEWRVTTHFRKTKGGPDQVLGLWFLQPPTEMALGKGGWPGRRAIAAVRIKGRDAAYDLETYPLACGGFPCRAHGTSPHRLTVQFPNVLAEVFAWRDGRQIFGPHTAGARKVLALLPLARIAAIKAITREQSLELSKTKLWPCEKRCKKPCKKRWKERHARFRCRSRCSDHCKMGKADQWKVLPKK